MTQEAVVGVNELEQLQRRFEEFRNLRPARGRLPADMLDLPNVERFLKKKKRNTNQDLQSFEIDENQGLVAVQPLRSDVSE